RAGPRRLSAALLHEVERNADRGAVRAGRIELRSPGDARDAARDRRGETGVARRRRGVDLTARSDLDEDDDLARLRRILLEAALVAALRAGVDLAPDHGFGVRHGDAHLRPAVLHVAHGNDLRRLAGARRGAARLLAVQPLEPGA